jgi:DNA-binding NtrC family response regulator
MPLTALVVNPRTAEGAMAFDALTSAGFHVTVCGTFESAKQRLVAQPPSVLVTELYLREFNGLHLVIRAKSTHPHMAAIVTCEHDDAALRAETERLGATFALTPLSPSQLMAAVFRTMFRGERDSEPIRPPYERRSSERRSNGHAYAGVDRRMRERRRDPLSQSHA